jgi:hypothetical protein
MTERNRRKKMQVIVDGISKIKTPMTPEDAAEYDRVHPTESVDGIPNWKLFNEIFSRLTAIETILKELTRNTEGLQNSVKIQRKENDRRNNKNATES